MSRSSAQQPLLSQTVLKPRRAMGLRRDYQLYLLMILPIAYFIVFKYVPMYGAAIAFQNYSIFQGVSGSEWVGFDNFRQLFAMSQFYQVVRNTLLLNFLDLFFSFPAPIVLALLLNELRVVWFKKVAQTILYLPHFISWIIIGGLVYQMFATNGGLVNNLIVSLGLEAVPFLTEKTIWVLVYLGTGIWHSAGWGTIIYLAALTGINKELYEAAEVDGAGRMKKMWHITLPGIRSTIVVMLIMQLGHIMTIGFERPFVMGNPLVMDYAEVISTFVYKSGLQAAQFSLATAMGLFQALVGLIFVVLANTIAKRFGEQGIW
ncbi:binding-protein-dependent transport systems inner membrane component [Paenibacillus mucilaginosus 3016]|uniref:Binding-protein-dependent transport systems inner membrane component n=2 Tax=Paenibacillus mucilaginosus TaxID=61624 RepID=H6NJE4_9BACL|nr:ABC transporter permease subunit [Paenibacillus mucilaginosus]AFC29223.1 binding-protein-dependent transport systems inner membrane component [Paenibacillus mucilaginosus 3016]AFH61403.1 protein lplB [Paenibacillus mucilaginosus K02]WFA17951.1 sugar ABC transporter permease [Paenibacillus mucilaginosus]